MKAKRLFISGLGYVGRAVLELLPEASSPRLLVVGLSDSSGALYAPDGFSEAKLERLRRDKAAGKRLAEAAAGLGAGVEPAAASPAASSTPETAIASAGRRTFLPGRKGALAAIAAARPDILAELSPTELSGGAAVDYALAALGAGADLVFASKGALAGAWDRVVPAAEAAGRRLRYSATVGGGMPVIDAGLAFSQANPLESLEAVLNGTSVYVLSLMEEGMDLARAVAAAQAAGMAEADPSADLDGWDAAAKLCILSRTLFGRPLSPAEVRRTSLRELAPGAIAEAKARGRVIRAVGRLDASGARIELVELDPSSPLARRGAENAVVYRSRFAGDLALIGKGAGPRETAAAVLRDLSLLSST
jgi:homoserine dehydrogenase